MLLLDVIWCKKIDLQNSLPHVQVPILINHATMTAFWFLSYPLFSYLMSLGSLTSLIHCRPITPALTSVTGAAKYLQDKNPITFLVRFAWTTTCIGEREGREDIDRCNSKPGRPPYRSPCCASVIIGIHQLLFTQRAFRRDAPVFARWRVRWEGEGVYSVWCRGGN